MNIKNCLLEVLNVLKLRTHSNPFNSMTPNNTGIRSQPSNPSIRSQPKPYRRSWAGTKCFSRIPTLVTQGKTHGLETKTINKTEASD